MGRSKEWRAFL